MLRCPGKLRYSTVSSGDPQLDIELWSKTILEVEKGWLVGPLSWDDLPETSVVSKRFPLVQGEKLRPIDDYSRSQVNSAIYIYEQVTTDGIDVVAAMISHHMKMLTDSGRSSELVGRSLDLSAAYRQLCISEESKLFSYVAVYGPGLRRTALQADQPFWVEGGGQCFYQMCSVHPVVCC